MRSFSRRKFLSHSAQSAAFILGAASCATRPVTSSYQIMTTLGPRPADQMQITLSHEHLLVDFIGADKVSPSRYDPEEVFRVALPHLNRAKTLGCRTFVDCTPAFLGRDAQLLRRLAEASGVQIITNTGYYGAGKNKYLPAHALNETAQQLASRWIQEAQIGIDKTGVRPGFIKIGVDSGPLSDLHQKLVRAAALTHLATGLTIAAHTGNGTAALDELRIVQEEGVHPNAFVWVHAQSETDATVHRRAAEAGAWVEFDGISDSSMDRHVELLQNLKGDKLLSRALISQDAGWYHVGEPGGGNFRPYDLLFTRFLPALAKAGFTQDEITRLLIDQPKEAFSIRMRRR